MRLFRVKYKIKVACANKGSALLIILMVMIALTSMVVGYLGFVQASTKSTGAQIVDSQVFYLAEAGLHYGMYNLNQDSGWTGDTDHSLGEGNFTVTSTDLGGDDYRLISTATLDDQSRTVQQDVSLVIDPNGTTVAIISNTWREQ